MNANLSETTIINMYLFLKKHSSQTPILFLFIISCKYDATFSISVGFTCQIQCIECILYVTEFSLSDH